MNKAAGRVTFEGTGVGVSDLLVSLYNLDSKTQPEEIHNLRQSIPGSDFWTRIPGNRLGSVLTDTNGVFELTYEDCEFHAANREQRPSLMLLVTAPESSKHTECPLVLHISCGIRQNAGRTESFLVRLTADQLKQADIPFPGTLTENPDAIINERIEEAERDYQLAEAHRALTAQKIERQRKSRLEVTKKLEGFYGSVSTITEAQKNQLSFVEVGESVEAKNAVVIADGIRNVINNPTNRAPITARFPLTEAQRRELMASADTNGNIPGEVVDRLLFSNGQSKPFSTVLIRQDPLDAVCRDKSDAERCAEKALGLMDEEDNDGSGGRLPIGHADATGDGIEPVSTSADIPRYIARLMETTTSPEESVSFGVTVQQSRADQTAVQENIDALSLRAGPADVPAIYEFHHLQIAFESVWQEAIDQGILDIAADAYHQSVELGIDPEAVIGEDGECPHARDPKKGADPNVHAIAAFDITWEQWNALSDTEQAYLSIAAIQALKWNSSEQDRQYWREQGQRITRYATSKLIAGTGEYDHLHELLRELKHRLASKYSFTPFAANCKERSINFGILVTYLAKLAPIAYQVGELVKTITLPPNATTTIQKKVTKKKRRAEKEAERNIISQREDATETFRAEDQIIRKAQSKTNFHHVAEGTFEMQLYGGTVTTTFEKEAKNSSDDIKKNFHESIVKSVYEYKQERNVEISTEESELIETVESAKLKNNNDEIPVTFLLYELQRRYYISEQIHKAMPVIFVAQEVPEQIDEVWVKSYSWILRRISLDDTTVLPALNYLSSNVVGDEVALRELRKNIEQQRRIVEESRKELAALRERATFLNSLLEVAVYQKAGLIGGDESEGGGGGFSFSDVLDIGVDIGVGIASGGLTITADALAALGDELFGGDDTQDPFAAARSVANRASKRANDLRRILEREENALDAITDTYTKKLSDHLNRKAQISCLLAHIKQNILYYLQGIWLHESVDQRSCRLRNVKVPILKGSKRYRFASASAAPDVVSSPFFPDVEWQDFEVIAEIDPDFGFTTLGEVADLDNLLGFMCNYMIFPLKEGNALTEFMLEPYRDPIFELKDPDERGNGTLIDFAKLVCCLEKKHPEKFDELKDVLKKQYVELRSSFGDNVTEAVVPTDSHYIDALPGARPILEDFKLMHRAIDVKKVQCEVRECELDNVRQAARLLAAKDDTRLLEDPDIESIKKVFVSGHSVEPSLDVGEE